MSERTQLVIQVIVGYGIGMVLTHWLWRDSWATVSERMFFGCFGMAWMAWVLRERRRSEHVGRE